MRQGWIDNCPSCVKKNSNCLWAFSWVSFKEGTEPSQKTNQGSDKQRSSLEWPQVHFYKLCGSPKERILNQPYRLNQRPLAEKGHSNFSFKPISFQLHSWWDFQKGKEHFSCCKARGSLDYLAQCRGRKEDTHDARKTNCIWKSMILDFKVEDSTQDSEWKISD